MSNETMKSLRTRVANLEQEKAILNKVAKQRSTERLRDKRIIDHYELSIIELSQVAEKSRVDKEAFRMVTSLQHDEIIALKEELCEERAKNRILVMVDGDIKGTILQLRGTVSEMGVELEDAYTAEADSVEEVIELKRQLETTNWDRERYITERDIPEDDMRETHSIPFIHPNVRELAATSQKSIQQLVLDGPEYPESQEMEFGDL